MREFVDERHLRLAREYRVEVHLLERAAAVGDDTAGNSLQTLQELRGQLPVIGLGEADDDVRAAREPAVALTEHRVRLSHPGRRAEVDAQLTAFHAKGMPHCGDRDAWHRSGFAYLFNGRGGQEPPQP